MKRDPAPGAALRHPMALAALAILIFNDHWLKHVAPGVITGKLSDFSGVIVLPLFLQALLEVGLARSFTKPLPAATCNRLLKVCVTASLLAFSLPEVWPPAETLYRYGLSAARLPFESIWAWLAGAPAPRLLPVRATADVTDLLAVPFAFVALFVGRRGVAGSTGRRDGAARAAGAAGRATLAALSTLSIMALSEPTLAAPRQAFPQHGVYLDAQLGTGAAWVSSSSSVSNGFSQALPSSARTLIAPALAVAVGGTLPDRGLALGTRLGVANGPEPVIDTLDRTFRIPGQRIIFVDLLATTEYYPNPERGFYVGAGLGGAALGLNTQREGALLGVAAALEAGRSWFLARRWRLGGVVRVTGAHLFGRKEGAVPANLVMPLLLVTLRLHSGATRGLTEAKME